MYQIIEVTAVVSGAVYGILLARRHHMDFVGVFSLALMVAFGGGTLRDLFLDRHPLFWIGNPSYPVVVFVLALITSAFAKLPAFVAKSLHVPEAMGLGLFSIAGVNAAIDSDTSLFIASLMGVITGTFGGVIGDVVCNRVPDLFRTAPLNATCSFVGCWLLFGLQFARIDEVYAAPIAIAVIVIFRLLAIHRNWHLPQIEPPPETSIPPQ